MASPFRRTLPARADLAQQKTLAKELLRVFAGGDPEATARVRAALPDKARIVLADAQFVLAREYGFDAWKIAARRLRVYTGKDNAQWNAFGRGWTNRVAALLVEIGAGN